MSDFLHNLVRRGAGLGTGVSARPPFQPSFASDLPTVHRGASLPPAAETPPPVSHEHEMPVEAPAPADDRGVVSPQWQDVEPAARVAPAPPPVIEDTGAQPSPVRRPEATVAPRQMPPATPVGPPRAAVREERVAVEPPTTRSAREPLAVQPPGPVQPRARAEAFQVWPLANDQAAPRRPSALGAVEWSAPRSQAVISAEVPHVAAGRETAQPAAVERSAPLRVEEAPTRELGPGPRASEEPVPALVRPAPAPPPPRLTVGPLAPPQATIAGEVPAVQVRIGTVEVRASRPAPSAPPPPRPRPRGFDDYAHLRGQEWE